MAWRAMPRRPTVGSSAGSGDPRTARVLQVLSAANLGFLLLLWFAEAMVAERHWLVMLVTYMPQHLFVLPTVPLLLASILRRNRPAAFLNGISAAICLWPLMGLCVPVHLPSRSECVQLRVLTCNIHHGAAGVERLAALVRRVSPDVVCLEEANGDGPLPDPKPRLESLLLEWHATSVSDRQIVMSRLPIESERAHWFPCTRLREIVHAVVLKDGVRVNVVDAHFFTSESGDTVFHHQGSMRSFLREAANARAKQFDRLVSVTQGMQGPVIIAGDFNSPPRGGLYMAFSRRFTDSFRAAGFGFGCTYPAAVPLLRIDYIYGNDAVGVRRCRTLADRVSDHRAVVADLVVESQGRPRR